MAKRGRPPKNKQRGKKDAQSPAVSKSSTANARSESGRFISRAEAGSKVGRPRKRAYDAPGVVLFDLPALILTSVQSCPARSDAPVQLEEWSDTQLSGLRSELDSLLTSVRALSKKLGGETDYMGVTMKNCTEPHLRALLESDMSADELRISTNNAGASSNKRSRNAGKFNSKRSRRDSTAAVAEDEEMTDINVVDVDDSAHSIPVPDDVSEPDLNSSYDAGSTNRNRNKKKSGRASSARDRKKKKKKAEEVSTSEDDYIRQPTTSANFWQSISPFYKTLAVADLLPLQSQSLSDSDPDFVIPPLGKHYSESSRASEAGWNSGNGTGAAGRGKNGLDGDVRCGDVTQRILAALIEEKLIVDPSPTEDSFLSSTSLPLDSPPTADYSRATMMSLDDRIRLELRSIGLLDDDDDDASGNREDDEICAEVRHLQGQLREQIRVNNERRRIFLRRAQVKMAEQQSTNARRAENKAVEQLFLRRMKLKAKIKKKKGRPPRAKPTRSSTAAAAVTPPATNGKGPSTEKAQGDSAVPPPVNDPMDTVPPPPSYAV